MYTGQVSGIVNTVHNILKKQTWFNFQETKNSPEDKSKRKLADPPDKGGSKKTPPTTTVSSNKDNQCVSDAKHKTHTNISVDTGSPHDKGHKTQEKSDKLDKTEKLEKSEVKLFKPHKTESKAEKIEKTEVKANKHDRDSEEKNEKDNRADKDKVRTEKLEKSDWEKDPEPHSDSKLDFIDKTDRAKGADSRNEYSKEKLDEKPDKMEIDREDNREREHENVSYKDSASIPPIHQSGFNLQNSTATTPSIPSISRYLCIVCCSCCFQI